MSSIGKLFWVWTLLGTGALVVLTPLGVVLITSYNGPAGWTGLNYQQAWQQGDFLLGFANSMVVALGVTTLQLITSTLGGYALARLEFRGRSLVLVGVVTSLVIPFPLLVIPVFIVLKNSHLLNTYGALILPTAANGFGVFLLRQAFLSLPKTLEEAAVLDGANQFQVFWRVMLPLVRPALVTLSLFTFIGEWNDLFKPLVFTTRPQLRTVQLILAGFQEQFTSNWPLMMAAVVIATLPVLVLFFWGQRYILQGVASTGIKG